jgi:ATPase subunit of ABC transporter with duplicated ATPase domains
MTSILTARDLAFDLPDGRTLFQGVDLSLDGRPTALVGPNGVGKTCLARVLAGELVPSRGSIRRSGVVTLFPQRMTPESMPVGEFLAGVTTWSPLAMRLLAGVDPEASCATLSGGQWMRVRLARVLEAGFLVLDEPTNDLDRETRQLVVAFVRDRGALVISHDRELLAACDDILELSSKGLARYGGGWGAYEAERRREQEAGALALERAKSQRDAARMAQVEQRTRQEKRTRAGARVAARGGIPRILVGKRKSAAQVSGGKREAGAVARTEEAARAAHEAFRGLKRDPVMYAAIVGKGIAAQKLVAEATDFNVRFSDWVFPTDLSFTWRGNVRVAVSGANGTGKSTLLRALAGDDLETRGILRRGELTTLVLDQRLATLEDARSVFDNVREHSDLSDIEVRNGLATFLFTGDRAFQPVGTLSGGERLRAAFAQGFLRTQTPELLVLDEPTNNLDLPNIEFVEGLVRAFGGALVVVSHDDVFLENCGVGDTLRMDERSE